MEPVIDDPHPASPRLGRHDRLALIEVLERDGRPGRSTTVHRWPLTLGRALDNDVVLDDPHVAAHHAMLTLDAQGRLQLEVGDSINGVTLGRTRHEAGAQLLLPPEGTELQLGTVRLRLRLPGETLAPERPLQVHGRAHLAGPLLAGMLVLLLALADHWVSIDPGVDAAGWLPVAVGMPLVLVGWCSLWALASKLFQHRFDFIGHLRIVLPWLLAIEAVDLLLTPLAASLGWPWLWRLVGPLQLLLALLLLRAHLQQVLPQSGRVLTTALSVAALVGSAISLTFTHRATDRYSRPPYMSTLPLPALHLAQPVSAQQLVQDLGPLAEGLAKRVQKAKADEPPEGDRASE